MRFSVLAFALIIFMTAGVSAQYPKGSLEAKLIDLDKAWTFAELKGDKKAAAAMVADDYVGTTQRGDLENKMQYLGQLAPNADMVRSDDYKIRIFGNTAIMTHRATVQGVRNMQFRSTHVWQKRKGKWLIIAHHGSQILPQPETDNDKHLDRGSGIILARGQISTGSQLVNLR